MATNNNNKYPNNINRCDSDIDTNNYINLSNTNPEELDLNFVMNEYAKDTI
jgi:hypothetical protein